MLKRMIGIELRKALKNKLLYITILLGCSITMLSFANRIAIYQNELLMQESSGPNPMQAGMHLFNNWIGGEAFSLGSSIYFLCSLCWRQFPMAGPTARKNSAVMSGWRRRAAARHAIICQNILLFFYPAGLGRSFRCSLISC